MNVYANYIKLDGSDAYDVCLRSIHGWLKEKIGKDISLAEITRDGEFNGKSRGLSTWLRSYSCLGDSQSLHAWRMKHNDADIRGRQWIIELGLKSEQNFVEFSCTVQTDDQSTLVTAPVIASRPKIIKFILENISTSNSSISNTVPGRSVRRIGDSTDSYLSFKAEIERENRDHPIVLVSPTHAGDYLFDRTKLQESLFGLAQVVEIDRDFNSYDMEEALGRRWSAWDGAINIIHPPIHKVSIRTTLLRSNEIDDIGENEWQKISYILARVTHNTNISRLKHRIRPEGVSQLVIKRRLEKAREKFSATGESISKDELDLLWAEIDTLNERLQTTEDERDKSELLRMQIEDEKTEIEYKLSSLKYTLQGNIEKSEISKSPIVNTLLQQACSSTQPTPEECLEIVETLYNDRCEILSSATISARGSDSFENGRRLLDMLKRLTNEFYEAFKAGGDNRARATFTNAEYSANESETVMNSNTLRQYRIFKYKDSDVEMFRHLKIGVADDVRKTIRVHFYWDAELSKIVIGYCGAHLPISSH